MAITGAYIFKETFFSKELPRDGKACIISFHAPLPSYLIGLLTAQLASIR